MFWHRSDGVPPGTAVQSSLAGGATMLLRLCVTLRTLWAAPLWWFVRASGRQDRRGGDRGQTTAEYALVIIGAATVALMLLTWATGSGKISSLLDKVVDTVADMVT